MFGIGQLKVLTEEIFSIRRRMGVVFVSFGVLALLTLTFAIILLFQNDTANPNIQNMNSGNSSQTASGQTTNLLSKPQDWKYMPGATISDNNLEIRPLHQQIVSQDGKSYQPNPTIDLYGPVLNVSGSFSFSATIKGQDFALQLYGAPPKIYDEVRFEGPSMRLAVSGDSLVASLWNGSKQTPVEKQSFTINDQSETNLRVSRNPGQLEITADGKTIGTLSERGIFNSGRVWFGFESTGNNNIEVSRIEAASMDGGKIARVFLPDDLGKTPIDSQRFQQLADKKYPGKMIGVAMSLGPLVSDDSYRNLALGGWYGLMTTENSLKPQFVEPQRGVFDFSEGEALVDVAHKSHLQVHGHTLVFGEANPQWMNQSVASDREAIMKAHITGVVSHYGGKIASWDVVNEPLDANFFDGPLKLRNHIWYQAMGEKYIDTAFATAHAADPQAKLFINEFGLEADGDRWNGFVQLLNGMLQRGVPVDGVGFQAHVYQKGDEIDPVVLRKHFEQIAQLGAKYNHPLLVRISEMDVLGHNSSLQTNQFAYVLKTCMEAPNCRDFTMWGISEKYGSTSWVDDEEHLQIGDGLPFDANNQPLNAVTAMQNVLR